MKKKMRRPNKRVQTKKETLDTLIINLLIICAVILVVYCVIRFLKAEWTPASNAQTTTVNGNLEVSFIDVGQGNAILFSCDGKNMLFDGGDDRDNSVVVSYLREKNIDKLDYMICSHYDKDHVNGLIEVLGDYPVETALIPDYEHGSMTAELFLEELQKQNCEIIYPQQGSQYHLGEAVFTVVCPDSYDYADSNDNSIGIRLVYGETSFLICGDASVRMENQMLQSGLELESTVYLCSHHGSAGSNSADFLMRVLPEDVVISCGLGNNYGHPHEEVMELLKSMDISLYRTDKQDTIVVESDGKELTWNVKPTNDYSDGE